MSVFVEFSNRRPFLPPILEGAADGSQTAASDGMVKRRAVRDYSERHERAPMLPASKGGGSGGGRRAWKVLRHALPLLILLAYSAFGGAVFWQLESSSAVDARRATVRRINRVENDTAMRIIDDFLLNNGSMPADDLRQLLRKYAQSLGLQPRDIVEWTFWGSVFYAGTIYTTIGYGNIYPLTSAGRAFTVVYAAGGIPLLLFVLSDLGRLFCLSIWHCYALISVYLRRGCCGDAHARIGDFPFSLAILLSVAWILLCSALFCQWESWDYLTSVYFFFQSLTTIGLGDILPEHPRLLVWSFILIIIGMSLVSMCWNLMHIKIELAVEKTLEAIRASPADDADGAERPRAPSELDRIISNSDNSWLVPLIGGERRDTLVREWERKAKSRSRAVQATAAVGERAVQARQPADDAAVQTTDGAAWAALRARLPYREVRSSMRRSCSASDEMAGMLKELGFLLSDCQNIVKVKETTL